MRATINFDINVNRVNKTMWALVLEESACIGDSQAALEELCPETVLQGIEPIIHDLTETVQQLERYRQMLLGFEQARLGSQTTQPTAPALPSSGDSVGSLSELRSAMQNMKSFDSFLCQVDEAPAATSPPEEEVPNEEG